jgi:hypothetical protein
LPVDFAAKEEAITHCYLILPREQELFGLAYINVASKSKRQETRSLVAILKELVTWWKKSKKF